MIRTSLQEDWYGEGEASAKERFPLPGGHVIPYLTGALDAAGVRRVLGEMRFKGDLDDAAALAAEIQEVAMRKRLRPALRTHYMRTAFQKTGDATVRRWSVAWRMGAEAVLCCAVRCDAMRCDAMPGALLARHGAVHGARAVRVAEGVEAQLSAHLAAAGGGRLRCLPRQCLRHRPARRGLGARLARVCQVTQFPHAVLEVKLQLASGTEQPGWVSDLISSGYLREMPKFSKFVHGTACLNRTHRAMGARVVPVSALPYWWSPDMRPLWEGRLPSIPLPVPLVATDDQHHDDERHDQPGWRADINSTVVSAGPYTGRHGAWCEVGALLRTWFHSIVTCNDAPPDGTLPSPKRMSEQDLRPAT